MKKLISILAATSLVVSAPLSVVACGKKRPKIDDETDYTALLNNLQELCQQIFEKNMEEDFSEYLLMSFEDFEKTDNEIDLESLWVELKENQDNEGNYKVNQDSETFKTFDAFIKQKANLSKLKENANEDVLSNVNYKPLIKDGKNPFSKSTVKLTQLTFVDKINDGSNDERIFAIQYTISTEIEILDTTLQPLTHPLSFKSSMTFFEDKDLADEVNQISKDVSKAIVSDRYSNNYKLFHDDANLSRVSNNMANLSNFEQILKNDISQDVIEPGSNWSLNTDDLKFETGLSWTALSYGGNSGLLSFWNKSPWSKKVKEAFLNGGDDAIDELSKDNSDFIPITPNSTVLDFLKLYEDSARCFNTAFMWERYNEGSYLSKLVKSEGINLDQSVETPESRRLFALIGNRVKNIKIRYQSGSKGPIDFDLPTAFIVNRQYTTFENTQEWYNTYVKFNLLFNKEFLGFNKPQTSVASADKGNIFELTKPKSFDQSFEPDFLYDLKEIFSDMFSESLEKVKNSKSGADDDQWHPEYYLSSFNFYYMNADKFKVNEEGYVFVYFRNALIEDIMISTYYGIPASNFASEGSFNSNRFFIGLFNHMPVTEYGNGIKTPLKFNLKE